MQHAIGLASYAPQIYTGVWDHLAAVISMLFNCDYPQVLTRSSDFLRRYLTLLHL